MWLAANARGIPYDVWWHAWGIFAFLVGPLMIASVVAKRPRGERGLILAIVPIPLLLGLTIVRVAQSCNSFVSPRNCDPGAARLQGWLALGIATAAFIGIGVALSRYPPRFANRPSVIVAVVIAISWIALVVGGKLGIDVGLW